MQEIFGPPEEIRPHLEGTDLVAALEYWEQLRGDHELPAFESFDPMSIAGLLSAVILLDCLPDDRFVYRLAGSKLERRYQVDTVNGKTPEEIFGADVEKVVKPYRRVRDTRCLFFRNASQDWVVRDPSFLAYKVLLLPFGSAAASVTNILGAFHFLRD